MPAAQAERLLQGPITKEVGDGKKNLALDVALIQSLINTIKSLPSAKTSTYKIAKPIIHKKVKPDTRLVVNGKFSDALKHEIEAFQGLYCNFKPDGAIAPNKTTWKTLLRVSGVKITRQNKIKTIFGEAHVKHDNVLKNSDKALLKTLIKNHLQIVNANEDLSGFLTALFADATMTNIRWAAYYTATAYHETAFTFKPLAEHGKGSGRAYGTAEKVKDTYGYLGKKGTEYNNTFYGRGYVQITHAESYKYISDKIGLRKDELYINPDKALETATAYKILTYWMQNNIPKVKGAGRRIQEHITAHGTPNYVSARKVVNGSDKAALIASYATVTEALIRLSAAK
ncbi:MAG: hypothetical protein JKY93_02120 [Gammaproteobacteria bacterium]|nr:hypothetical protein [Gammaproteobacteria bacterium]